MRHDLRCCICESAVAVYLLLGAQLSVDAQTDFVPVSDEMLQN